jgi:hypothetical protein
VLATVKRDNGQKAERLEDYRLALAAYLDLLSRGVFRAIVFAENSGASLDVLRRLADSRGLSERVEFGAHLEPVHPLSEALER